MRYGTLNMDYAAGLVTAEPEQDGPIWMVNFMRYRPLADYADGRETTLSGREADDLYAPVGVLMDLGAEVAFFAEVSDQLGGDGWDRIAIVVYPTRRSFAEMQNRPDFQELHVHKDAGMDFTIILAALPTGGSVHSGESKQVRVTAYPAGYDAPPWNGRTCRFDVEGLVIGDERRFDTLDITWSPGEAPAPPPGSLTVTTAPLLDRIDELLRRA